MVRPLISEVVTLSRQEKVPDALQESNPNPLPLAAGARWPSRSFVSMFGLREVEGRGRCQDRRCYGGTVPSHFGGNVETNTVSELP